MTVSGDPVHLMKAQSGYLLNTKKKGAFEEKPEVIEEEEEMDLSIYNDLVNHPWYYEQETQFDFNDDPEELNDPAVVADPVVTNDPVVSNDPVVPNVPWNVNYRPPTPEVSIDPVPKTNKAPKKPPKVYENVLYMDPYYVEHFGLVTDKICIEPIEMLVEFEKDHESPLAKRLSPKVLDRARDHFGKMDAKPHLAIFHKDTCSAITFMVENFGWPKEYLTTAQHIYLVAHWFEIVSERGLCYAFSKKNPKQKQEMLDFLDWFAQYIAKVRYYHNQKMIRTVQKGTIAACWSAEWLVNYLFKDPTVDFLALARALLTDIIENHHFRVRRINKNPTCKQVVHIQKSLMVTQLLTKVGKGHNYLQDDSTRTMFDFETLNQVLQDEQTENTGNAFEKEIQEYQKLFIDSKYDPRDFQSDKHFAEANSLTNYIGFCINKRLKGKTCECKKIWRKQKGDEEDTLNMLMEAKAIFSPHPNCNPSYFANTVFHTAEMLFRRNRGLNLHVKQMDVKLKDDISSNLKEIYPAIPTTCQHFDAILKLFITGRLHYYAKHLDKFGHEEHKVEILQGAAHGSKSTASMVVLK